MKSLFGFIFLFTCISLFSQDTTEQQNNQYARSVLYKNSTVFNSDQSVSNDTKYTEQQKQNKQKLFGTSSQNKSELITNYSSSTYDISISVSDFNLNVSFETIKTSYQANQLIASMCNVLQNQSLTLQQIQYLIIQQDKLIDYLQKNHIDYDKQVFSKTFQASILNIVVYKTVSKQDIDKLISTISSTNNIAGWVFQNIKDYYLYSANDIKELQIEKWNAWKQIILSKPKPVSKVQYIVPKGRWMFQVWTPQNDQQQNNLMQQLDYIKSRGYIGVVCIWNGTSDYKKLVSIQQKILNKGLKIWLAFSTTKQDKIDTTSFVEPIYYSEGLKQLAKKSQAFLMGWRRTSLHLNQQNVQWQNYTMQALRSGNPKIGFIGQSYFGYNGTHDPNQYHLYINYRDNYNAILSINFGFISVNPKWALNKIQSVVPKKTGCQYICLIQGITATYLKQNNNSFKKKRTKAQYRRINELLQKRFLRAGFDAVIGLSGDGVNRQGAQDDMCLSKNRINDSTLY